MATTSQHCDKLLKLADIITKTYWVTCCYCKDAVGALLHVTAV